MSIFFKRWRSQTQRLFRFFATKSFSCENIHFAEKSLDLRFQLMQLAKRSLIFCSNHKTCRHWILACSRSNHSLKFRKYLIDPCFASHKLSLALDLLVLIPPWANLAFPPFRAAINVSLKKVRNKIRNWGKRIENSK